MRFAHGVHLSFSNQNSKYMRPEYKFFGILWIGLMPFVSNGQKENLIVFTNPSFEDVPRAGQAPMGWYNCGAAQESPPDVQPGVFQVVKPPSNGSTYLGLVVRDNETWEAVSQRMSKSLERNQCYEFSMDICRSETYISLSKTTNQEVNYTTPVKLRIWAGNGYCDRAEMLYETPLVVNTRWLKQDIRLTPKKGNYNYIIFEAFFKTPSPFPYNGNLLLDNVSPIRQVPCGPEPVLAAKKPPVRTGGTLTARGAEPAPKPVQAPEVTMPATPPAETRTEAKMERKNLKKGMIIRLDKVYFDANKYEIKSECEAALEELASFLLRNEDLIVEVGGHTNNRAGDNYANQLSTNRARAVAEWLVEQGVPDERVQFKGYGKTMPVVPNDTDENMRKNQRVEIKILNIN